MNSKIICEICNSEFVTKLTLSKHQRTAKFCLRIKKEKSDGDNVSVLEKCKFCNEEFTTDAHLNRHYKICKVKKEKDEEEYKKNLLEKINISEKENQKLKTEILLLKEQIKIKNEQHEKELKLKDEFIDILQSKINKDTKLYTVSYLKMANQESDEKL